jgi:hypothetical protein
MEKRNEKVNYQIYTAMEVFKTKRAYLYVVKANKRFELDSFEICAKLRYDRLYFFEEWCLRFINRYFQLMLKPLLEINFCIKLSNIETRKLKEYMVKRTTELRETSKMVCSYEDLRNRSVPLDKTMATCYKSYRKRRVQYLFKI